MASKRRPKLGDIVHFVSDRGKGERAAIINHVTGMVGKWFELGAVVGLSALTTWDDLEESGWLEYRGSDLMPTLEHVRWSPYSEGREPGTWHWPDD